MNPDTTLIMSKQSYIHVHFKNICKRETFFVVLSSTIRILCHVLVDHLLNRLHSEQKDHLDQHCRHPQAHLFTTTLSMSLQITQQPLQPAKAFCYQKIS